MRLIADGSHSGKPEVYANRPADFLIVPLVAEKYVESFFPPSSLRIEEPAGTVTVRVNADPATAGRVHLYQKQTFGWQHQKNVDGWRINGNEFALSVTPGTGADKATLGSKFVLALTDDKETLNVQCRVTPVLLTSSLDPVTEVLVVRNYLSRKFVDTMARLVPLCAGQPKLRPISFERVPQDLGMQGMVEMAVAPVPDESGAVRQTTVALRGLRAKYDSLNAAPMDEFVGAYCEADPNWIAVTPGNPRPDTRRIDWYGNLEVSPPLSNYPYGRIITGEQDGFGIHPELLAFLEAQLLQWPPLALDVSWLKIGNVDTIINFVPAKTAPEWRVLLPSPLIAFRLLRDAAAAGHGDVPVFKGRTKRERTVKQLLDLALSSESKEIEEALRVTRARIKEGLGIMDAAIVDLPVLFEDGAAVIPNPVNSLVVGKTVFLSAPEGPVVDGIDLFERAIRARLEPLGLTLNFMDTFELFHTRSGEVHFGTNAVRRLRNPAWWRVY